MSRKDYRIIARALRNANATISAKKSEEGLATLQLIIINLESELKEDNPNFSRERFRAAIFGPYSLKTV